MGYSKTSLFLALMFVVVLLVSSEVLAQESLPDLTHTQTTQIGNMEEANLGDQKLGSGYGRGRRGMPGDSYAGSAGKFGRSRTSRDATSRDMASHGARQGDTGIVKGN
ncbi:Glycine rich protein [Trema orientale]|uniref:Glycine rich protein n=1 Tax=Trema orientale TaxID=63057 RepID=A0A2P5EZP3_TREOI|nr:Glycine rich protein [Trema orientale]